MRTCSTEAGGLEEGCHALGGAASREEQLRLYMSLNRHSSAPAAAFEAYLMTPHLTAYLMTCATRCRSICSRAYALEHMLPQRVAHVIMLYAHVHVQRSLFNDKRDTMREHMLKGMLKYADGCGFERRGP
jgi:hypothetical protein